MAPHYDSTGSEVVRWQPQPQQRELVPSSKGASHSDLVKHTGKMASDSQQYNGFTEDDLREYEQEQREYELLLDISAKSGRKPRNHKQKMIMEHIAKEKEQKKLNKYRWMVISPLNKTPEVLIEAQFDTGADLNYITEALVRSLGLTKELLKTPRGINTAVGPGGECEFYVSANWQGRQGCGGRVKFLVLPETSPITTPLIGIEGKECWDGLMEDKPPVEDIRWTTLRKEKAPEKIESAALRTAVMNEQSQLQLKKEAHENRRSSSSKSKGSRPNEKKDGKT